MSVLLLATAQGVSLRPKTIQVPFMALGGYLEQYFVSSQPVRGSWTAGDPGEWSAACPDPVASWELPYVPRMISIARVTVDVETDFSFQVKTEFGPKTQRSYLGTLTDTGGVFEFFTSVPTGRLGANASISNYNKLAGWNDWTTISGILQPGTHFLYIECARPFLIANSGWTDRRTDDLSAIAYPSVPSGETATGMAYVRGWTFSPGLFSPTTASSRAGAIGGSSEPATAIPSGIATAVPGPVSLATGGGVVLPSGLATAVPGTVTARGGIALSAATATAVPGPVAPGWTIPVSGRAQTTIFTAVLTGDGPMAHGYDSGFIAWNSTLLTLYTYEGTVRTTDWIDVEPSTKYRVESDGNRLRIQFRDESGTITWSSQSSNAPTFPVVITTASDTVEMRIYYTVDSGTTIKVYPADAVGMTDLDLPIESFQARLRSGSPSYLAIIVPAITAYEAEITARATGDLILYKGAQSWNGVRNLEPLLRVGFDAPRYDIGGNSASGTLSGTRQRTNSGPVRRTITGVSYRSVTTEGTVRLRADIDYFLRAGDTAVYGTDEFTVSEIAYIASPGLVYMEVVE